MHKSLLKWELKWEQLFPSALLPRTKRVTHVGSPFGIFVRAEGMHGALKVLIL